MDGKHSNQVNIMMEINRIYSHIEFNNLFYPHEQGTPNEELTLWSQIKS